MRTTLYIAQMNKGLRNRKAWLKQKKRAKARGVNPKKHPMLKNHATLCSCPICSGPKHNRTIKHPLKSESKVQHEEYIEQELNIDT